MGKYIYNKSFGPVLSNIVQTKIVESSIQSSSIKQYNKPVDTMVFLGNPSSAYTNVYNSTDGIGWNTKTIPSGRWNAVKSAAYGNNIFLVLEDQGNKSATSSDGITWTQGSFPNSDGYNKPVAYGNGTFVSLIPYAYTVYSSTDAITWTQRTGAININFKSIAYGDGKFVAVGYSATGSYSTDGITWTSMTAIQNSWRKITRGATNFLITGANTTSATSTNGITWTQRTMPSGSWGTTAYGNNTFVASSNYQAVAATSTDSITWTLRTLPASARWISMVYAKNLFILSAQTAYYTSPDGITWTTRSLPTGMSQNTEPAVIFGNPIVTNRLLETL
jgi:sensor histidine kinase YesM